MRESLNLTSWQAASDTVHTWEAAGQVHAEEPRPRISTKDAVAKYLEDAKARGLKDASLTKFREVLERRLVEFAEGHGYRTLEQLDVEALREFRATWSYAPSPPKNGSNIFAPSSASASIQTGSTRTRRWR